MHSCSAEEAAALAAAASKRFDASSDARSEVTTCGMPEAVLGERPEDGDERSRGVCAAEEGVEKEPWAPPKLAASSARRRR